ncbi:MAG: DUF3093 domain-containing protein [Actinomycetota bacterium]
MVRPPFWLLLFIFFLLASLAVSIWAAFNDLTGLIALLLGLAATLWLRRSLALHIYLTEDELRVGNAHIERKYLADVVALNDVQMKLVRGRDADPAAFLALRFWQPRGVKININDERDPTPYWLITSKNSEKFRQALTS